jgi:hypothetical protein
MAKGSQKGQGVSTTNPAPSDFLAKIAVKRAKDGEGVSIQATDGETTASGQSWNAEHHRYIVCPAIGVRAHDKHLPFLVSHLSLTHLHYCNVLPFADHCEK